MAKTDDIGVFEQHLEKGVLGLCAAVLLCAVFYWLPSSPRRVEVISGRKEVAPEDVDRELLQEALRVQAMHRQVRPTAVKVPDLPGRIAALRGGLYEDIVPELAPLVSGRDQPLGGDVVGPNDTIRTSLAALQEIVPAPEMPYVRIERVLPHSDTKELSDVNIAHVVTIYPFDDALAGLEEKLKDEMRVDPIKVLAVEIQRQTDAIGADWEKIDIESVNPLTVPIYVIRDGKEVVLDAVPQVPVYTGKNRREVKESLLEISSLQEDIVQPKYWPIWGIEGQWCDWRRNLPPEPLKEIGAETIMKSGKSGAVEKIKTGSTSRQPSRPPFSRKDQERMRYGVVDFSPPPWEAARPKRKPIREVTARQPERARRSVATVADVELPSFQNQLSSGKVLVWVHDDSVEPGRTYRYRIRMKLRNPLLMREAEVIEANRKDAFVTALVTPWSQWSVPVGSTKATEFFLTGAMRSIRGRAVGESGVDDKVRVTVFTRSLGQRVSHAFTLIRGDAIGGRVRKTVKNPAWESSDDPEELTSYVDFASGAVLVDIDFTKTVVRSGITRPTVEIVYLDEFGGLSTCVVVQDMPADSQQRKRYDRLMAEAAEAQGEGMSAER